MGDRVAIALFLFGRQENNSAQARPAAGADAPLSGEKVTFVTASGGKFEVPREIAEQSGMVKRFLTGEQGHNSIIAAADDDDHDDDDGDDDDDDDEAQVGGSIEIPARVVSDEVLSKIVGFITHHHKKPWVPCPRPVPSDDLNTFVTDEFDQVCAYVYVCVVAWLRVQECLSVPEGMWTCCLSSFSLSLPVALSVCVSVCLLVVQHELPLVRQPHGYACVRRTEADGGYPPSAAQSIDGGS